MRSSLLTASGAAPTSTPHQSKIGRPAREQMLQRSVWICFHTQFESPLRGAINDGATVRFDEYCEHLDAWFGDMGHPSSAGVTVYVRGIAERKRLGEALRQSRIGGS